MVLDKRKIHHYLRIVQSLKTWQLVIILLLMIFVSATLLRINNLGMLERRQAVIEADKSGDEEKTLQALHELRKYVNSHMNTSLGRGVYLEQSYVKARDAAIEEAAKATATNPNSAAYEQASMECRSRFAGGTESFRNDYVQCVIDRVGSLTQGQDPTTGINLPKVDTYRYNFVSPVWSPDLAGFSVLFTLLIALAIVLRIAIVAAIKALLKRRHSSIYS